MTRRLGKRFTFKLPSITNKLLFMDTVSIYVLTDGLEDPQGGGGACVNRIFVTGTEVLKMAHIYRETLACCQGSTIALVAAHSSRYRPSSCDST